MDDWTSKQLPERLPFSKKRLPKKVIFSCVAPLGANMQQTLTRTDILPIISSSCKPASSSLSLSLTRPLSLLDWANPWYSVLLITFAIVDKIPPFHQHFALENYTLHYPFAEHERVPVPWLCVYVILAPAAIIALYTMVIDGLFSHQTTMPADRSGIKRLSGRYRFKDRLWELNCGILGLGLSIGAAFTITGALKNAIGKPRPDLISR